MKAIFMKALHAMEVDVVGLIDEVAAVKIDDAGAVAEVGVGIVTTEEGEVGVLAEETTMDEVEEAVGEVEVVALIIDEVREIITFLPKIKCLPSLVPPSMA